ncbi:alginate lyase family protein [Mucilaginibacter segetis]|uniref:Alginate lyase family protein n=1 Tax=Mucilaginibacter segetis TaxID=2793071 RepID=A0A934UM89_9SPHI|nr:alginate lyase family protein [Mucilaginibacter segetis]MBK0379388.1 alginate lyase family protein [Mucilaginibacter segetis]
MNLKIILYSFLVVSLFYPVKLTNHSGKFDKIIAATLREDVMKEAKWAMNQQPVTVTGSYCKRSTGSIHDFYSEGDYWWPNPVSADSAYIQRDGLTNPDNFVAHRLAMIRFSKIIGALASAYKLTHDDKYVIKALIHIKAWFVNEATLMNPNLQYAQAIKGRVTGRGIGIIDTIQLIEVAQGIIVMQNSPVFDANVLADTKSWFQRYLTWLTTSKFGHDEMNAKNNHGTCWVMQVAAFAKLTGNEKILSFCTDRFKNVLLPDQMAENGSFPLELSRTKPYGYSLFNLDAMITVCQILSDNKQYLFTYTTADGRSIKRAIEWMYPYISDKSTWPLHPDVMYWQFWPVAQPSLVFAACAYNNKEWLNTWKKLDHHPVETEVIRNLPVRHPLIWLN